MFFQIDPTNGIAIYEQVVRQVKFAVADGGLETGELIPSVRELSRQLALNPNTVARAYRQLQDDGVLEAVRGTGLQVAGGAPAKCRGERSQMIRHRLRAVLEEASHSGLSNEQMGDIVQKELTRVFGKHSS